MKGIKYISPLFDISGYGEASRNHILSLHEAGVNLTLKKVQYDQTSNFDPIFNELLDKDIDYDVVITHLTPNHYPVFAEKGKVNIGFMYWESSHIIDNFVKDINNNVDAMFAVCDYTVSSLVNSGVEVPVEKIIPAINTSKYRSIETPDEFFNINSYKYKFYSIFQWHERKNPIGLLKAYLSEFKKDENVMLIIKTHIINGTEEEKNNIIKFIESIKKALNLYNYPPIALICKHLSETEIWSLHKFCDCFVLPHRSEGLGLPHLEAMICANPVIATALGGNTEFMNNYNSYLVPFQYTPVFGMNAWYNANQYWAEPNLFELKKTMRYVFENQKEAQSKGKKGQNLVLNRYGSVDSAFSFIEAVHNTERMVSEYGLKNPL